MLGKRLVAIIVMLWVTSATFAQTRLGILYTQEELTIWRQRAQIGPYKILGDAGTNSPGDWTRIQKNADAFLLNPTAELTNAVTFKLGYETESKAGFLLRDAAFVSLILRSSNPTKADQYAKAVKNILLAQSRKTETDFTKYTYFGDMAGWVLAGFMNKYLFAYDFIKDADVLTAAEKTELNGWFYNSANFFARNLHDELGGMFKYRLKGDYTNTNGPAATGEISGVQYTHTNPDGSKVNKIVRMHKWYNNRRAAQALVVGLVDVFLKNVGYTAPLVRATANGVTSDNTLEVHAKAYVKEWVKYSVFADGMQGEFERGVTDNPFKGFNYSTCNLFVACMIADAYARRGDATLYTYSTSEGLWGTQGGSKSIRLAVESHMNMVDGTKKRYFSVVQESNRYQNVQVMNDNQHYISDVWYTMSNVYWKSSYQKGVYTRKGPGTVAYPAARIGSTAGLNAWGGEEHILPGMLFMYGQMDGKVWPYPSSVPTNKAPVATITSPTTGSTYAAGSNITINATATDADGTITKVEFFHGATKLGEDLTSPYSYTLSTAAATSYSLTVKATDNQAATAVSAAVNITMNKAPVTSITSPITNASFIEGNSITIDATATDSDGTVVKVEFFNGATKLGEDVSSPYSYTMSNAGVGAYSLTVKATDNLGASTTSAAVTINVNVATGQILREEWRNVIGSLISTIPLTTTPTSSSFLTSFEEASNVGDSLASRIRGYVHPTTSGNYTFWIAGDDYCELWLSTSEDPTQQVKIAFVNGYTKSRDWTKYASQQSAPIALLAGKKYYIEALHKENIGGDNLAVGWDLPDGSQERPIPGNRLSPFVPTSSARIEANQLTNVKELPTQVVSAFPNPVADILTIRLTEAASSLVTITIIDQLGQAVYKEEKRLGTAETTTSLDLVAIALKAGVYILKVDQQAGSKSLRIVKR